MLPLYLALSLLTNPLTESTNISGPAILEITENSHRLFLNEGTTELQLCGLVIGETYLIQLTDFQTSLTKNSQELIADQSCKTQFFEGDSDHWISIQCMTCESPKSLTGQASPIFINQFSIDEMVEEFLFEDACVTISNINYAGFDGSIGTFFNGSESLQMESGLLMSSGLVYDAAGPNISEGTSTFSTGYFDHDLAQTSFFQILDAAVLEFDIELEADLLSFEFIFGSEEYCEFIFTSFEDIMGIYVSGPGINGPFSNNAANIALTPWNQNPISTSSINHQLEPDFYISNALNVNSSSCFGSYPGTTPGLNDVEFDGFTVPLIAETPIIPCETYHVKIAIADTGDGILDSGVFLKYINETPPTNEDIIAQVLAPDEGMISTTENCPEAYLQIIRVNPFLGDSLVVYLEPDSNSTATEGLDYDFLPDSLIFPAFVDTLIIPITVFTDDLLEGSEFLEINISGNCTCISPILFIEDGGFIQSQIDTSVCWPNGVLFGDSLYYETGYYTDSISSGGGCDTLIALGLEIIGPAFDSISEVICAGDSVLFNGIYLFDEGFYQDTIIEDFPDCSTLLFLELSFIPPVELFDTTFICPGDSILFGSIYLNESGDYTDTIDQGGCLEINYLNLEVGDYFSADLSLAFCTGDSINYEGVFYNQPGIIIDTIPGMMGCDTIIEVVINENPSYEFLIDTSICIGEIYQSPLGNIYTTEGQFQDSFQTVNGCDSIYIINLAVGDLTYDTSYVSLCEGDSLLLGTDWITLAGVYDVVYTGVNNCDSIHTNFVTILPDVVVGIDITSCDDVYVYNGQTYNQSGSYIQSFDSWQGCDSVLVINLTLMENPQEDLEFSLCLGDTLVIGNTQITEAGNYEEILPAMGSDPCDTLVNISVLAGDYTEEFQTIQICVGDSVLVGSSIYYESGIYQDTFDFGIGCGTILNTSLFVIDPVYTNLDISLCEAEGGVPIGDTIYTESGNYTDTLVALNGCDSIINLQLEIAPTYAFLIDTAICADILFEYFGQIYPVAGTYVIPFISSEGCDSIYTIILDIIEFDDPTYDVEPDNGNNTGSILAMASGGIAPYSYDWSNGSTGPIQSDLAAGDYYVTITDDFGCTLIDTINVPLVIAAYETVLDENWSLYPNPASIGAEVVVEYFGEGNRAEQIIRIYGVDGRLVSTHQMNEDRIILAAPKVSGVYYLQIESSYGIKVFSWLVL